MYVPGEALLIKACISVTFSFKASFEVLLFCFKTIVFFPLAPSSGFGFHPYSFSVRKKHNNSVFAAGFALIYK